MWSITNNNNKKKLNKVFRELRKLGYTAHQDFWCCSSCGWAALTDEEAEKAVFYHHQDKQSMLVCGKVHLAWSGDGNEIVKVINDCGLKTEWNGTEKQRILIDLN